jgi:hypothetical protein
MMRRLEYTRVVGRIGALYLLGIEEGSMMGRLFLKRLGGVYMIEIVGVGGGGFRSRSGR